MDPIIELIDSGCGIYIAQTCAQLYGQHISGMSSDDMASLYAGPDDLFYCEAYDNLLNNGRLMIDGTTYGFVTHEDGSLAAYAIDYEFPENFWDNWY